MKIKTLIRFLEKEDPEAEIMVLDGSNGGGCPRTLNLGPSPRTISRLNASQADDCEDLVGCHVLVIGYGCY